MRRKNAAEIHAGSMADIAFLLLIFFLATTTIDKDKGILRRLPQTNDGASTPIHKRNVLSIQLDAEGALLVDETPSTLSTLPEQVQLFVDNGGLLDPSHPDHCAYCKGDRIASASDTPSKAVITIEVQRETPYKSYVAVQDILNTTYYALRDRYAMETYGWRYTEMRAAVLEGSYTDDLYSLKAKLKDIEKAYPLQIADIQVERGQ